jgi:hypothetical protein
MQLTQQIVNRTLECVWISSGEKLVCFWVQRERQFATPVGSQSGARRRPAAKGRLIKISLDAQGRGISPCA